MNWDELVYRITLLAVILGLLWLVLAPIPGHQSLVPFMHQALVA